MSEISVIVTALNEEDNLASAVRKLLEAFDSLNITGEALIMNDGSSDGTAEVARRLAREDSRVRVLSHKTPQGVGASFWDGMQAARGKAVMWLPGDGENDPADILRHLGLLEGADAVVPYIVNPEIRPLLRRMLSRLFRAAINLAFGTKFHYTNGTVIYRRELLRRIPRCPSGFFFQADMLVRLSRAGGRFAQVPCRLSAKREAGSSSAVKWSSFRQVCRDFLRLVWDVYCRRRGHHNSCIIS